MRPETKYKLVDYTPELRVTEFAGKYYVEMDECLQAMPSNHIGGHWTHIPGFKLYDTRFEAEQKMQQLIDSNFKISASCIVIELDIDFPL